ncbi:hypothetical protein P3S67_011041 [Capsicum chacoense]
MDAPTRTCWYALAGAIRSTTFLSAFVGIFQAAVCAHQKVESKDHKLVYWVAGALSGLSVLLEKKARRRELALYVLPRAADSLWYILVNRHLLPDIKNAEEHFGFVESQLQMMTGANLKQFCSEFIQEILPAFWSYAEVETSNLSLE